MALDLGSWGQPMKCRALLYVSSHVLVTDSSKTHVFYDVNSHYSLIQKNRYTFAIVYRSKCVSIFWIRRYFINDYNLV